MFCVGEGLGVRVTENLFHQKWNQLVLFAEKMHTKWDKAMDSAKPNTLI